MTDLSAQMGAVASPAPQPDAGMPQIPAALQAILEKYNLLIEINNNTVRGKKTAKKPQIFTHIPGMAAIRYEPQNDEFGAIITTPIQGVGNTQAQAVNNLLARLSEKRVMIRNSEGGRIARLNMPNLNNSTFNQAKTAAPDGP